MRLATRIEVDSFHESRRVRRAAVRTLVMFAWALVLGLIQGVVWAYWSVAGWCRGDWFLLVVPVAASVFCAVILGGISAALCREAGGR